MRSLLLTSAIIFGVGAAPATTLHYAASGNFDHGSYAAAGDPGSIGFNMADVSSKSACDGLPTGVSCLIWIGETGGVTSAFKSIVDATASDPKVFGYYIADEPPDSAASNLLDEVRYVHAHAAGKKAFIVAENNSAPLTPRYGITPSNTEADLIGLDPYPVRPASEGSEFASGINLDVINAAVAAAKSVGWTLDKIVPVYQAFGGGGYASWTLPTASQEKQILDRWGSLVPNPVFDYVYAWGQQSGDQSLATTPALQTVFAQHIAQDVPVQSPTQGPTQPPSTSGTAVTGLGLAKQTCVKSVAVTIRFSAGVTVSGSPSVSLSNGGVAKYSSGSGSANLVFRTGSIGANAASARVTTINLNGGSIKDSSGRPAALSLGNAGPASISVNGC